MPFIPSDSPLYNPETTRSSGNFIPSDRVDQNVDQRSDILEPPRRDMGIIGGLAASAFGPIGWAAATPIGQEVVKGVTRPFVRAGVTGAAALAAGGALAQERAFGIKGGEEQAREILDEGFDVPGFGPVTPIGAKSGLSVRGTFEDLGSMIGTGVEIGTTLGGSALSKAIPTTAGRLAAAKIGGAVGSLTGGLYGLGHGLAENEDYESGEAAVGSVLGQTLGGAFIGGILGAGLAAIFTPGKEKLVDIKKEPVLTRIKRQIAPEDEQAMSILREEVPAKERLQTARSLQTYMDQAKAAAKNPRVETPLESAGKKAEDAMRWYQKALKKSGEAKQVALKAVGDQKYQGIGAIKQELNNDIAERFGIQIKWSPAKEDWVVSSVKGRVSPLTEADQKLVLKLWNQVNDLKADTVTLRQADDVVDLLQNELYGAKRNLMVPVSGRVEGLFKKVTGQMNAGLQNQAGTVYQTANSDYAKFVQVRDWLNTNLGKEGSKGGALMKRVFSPSDAGTKAMFEQIRQQTGIDLVKESALAKFAMEQVGDPRNRGLLENLAIPMLTGGLKKRALDIAIGALLTGGGAVGLGAANRALQGK